MRIDQQAETGKKSQKINVQHLNNFLKYNALESMDSEIVRLQDEANETPEMLGPRLKYLNNDENKDGQQLINLGRNYPEMIRDPS